MSIPVKPRRARSTGSIRSTLLNDPITGLTLGTFAATAALYLLPFLNAEQLAFVSRRLGPFLFLSLVVIAISHRLGGIKTREDRAFWIDLLRGYACWWLAAFLILFFPSPEAKPFAVDVTTSILYALYYVALLMAIERQPHRRHRWRPLELERRLSWPTVVAVVLGLLLYFPLIAIRTNPEAYGSGIPDLCLYLALDGYLSLRLIYLYRLVSSPRWRLTYGLLAAATVAVFVTDVLEALALASGSSFWYWDRISNVLLYAPYICLVAAARLRHHPFPWEPPPPATRIRLEENLPGPLGQTMTFILLFPLIHFAAHDLAILDAASESRREVLILIWLPVLAVIAFVQYRLLARTLRELKEERQSTERALHKTQKELRLAQERQLTDEALRESGERFGKAFRACPDVMAISRFDDGFVLDVNESCLRVFGYRREELVGRTSEEVDFWIGTTEREEVLKQLRRDGHATLEMEFRTKSGEERVGLFSARTIDLDGATHIFSVTRDITEAKEREDSLRRRAAAIEAARRAIGINGIGGRSGDGVSPAYAVRNDDSSSALARKGP